MVPIPDDPVTPSLPRDPVRLLVQTALAVYLSPVILVVCLIGGLSIVASETAKITRQFTRKNHLGRDYRPNRLVKAGAGKLTTHRTADRGQSRIAR